MLFIIKLVNLQAKGLWNFQSMRVEQKAMNHSEISTKTIKESEYCL